MTDKPIILDSSPEAAQIKTVTGWVSRGGRFWGDDERMARYDGSTHRTCECGNVADKGYASCESCIAKKNRERYLALPLVEWDSKVPLYDELSGKYFFNYDEDEISECAEERGAIQLVICEPIYVKEIDSSIWSDDFPEDVDDGPAWLEKAIDVFNATIREHKDEPLAWYPGKKRVTLEPTETQP